MDVDEDESNDSYYEIDVDSDESIHGDTDFTETEDESADENSEDDDNEAWTFVSGSSLLQFDFQVPNVGFTPTPALVNSESSPLQFYKLFMMEDIIDNIVDQTNKYVEQEIIKSIAKDEHIGNSSFLAQWKKTNSAEILRYFGLLVWMGLDRKPRIRDYFSESLLYANRGIIFNSGISRTQFQSISTFLHFADNGERIDNSKLYKLNKVLFALNENFKKYFTPGQRVCIDETMVPFRGKLHFRQYIKGKRHKYGIKVFKLCADNGYTYNFDVYVGKINSARGQATSDLVIRLMQPLLDVGRTL